MTNPKGARFERLMADYLAAALDEHDSIDRQVKTGTLDRGDIRGVKAHGQPLAVECKNYAKPQIGPWLDEAERERGNIDGLAGVVIYKRHGKGRPGDQLVVMTARDFAALIAGARFDGA